MNPAEFQELTERISSLKMENTTLSVYTWYLSTMVEQWCWKRDHKADGGHCFSFIDKS